MEANGYLRLTDYGLAKIIKEDEKITGYAGTPEYIAPEMLNDENYNFSVDWWTLGIVAYELVSGKTPFYTGGKNYRKMEK